MTTLVDKLVPDQLWAIVKPLRKRGIESSTRLGRHRWKAERALSWLSCWRRLQVRWDRDSGRWFAFVPVACAVVCFDRR